MSVGRHARNLRQADPRRLRAWLTGHAATYAREVEALEHAALPSAPVPGNPRYLALIRAERRWLSVNPLIADVYTMRRTEDGTVFLLVDSETDYNKDGVFSGDREGRTEPGEVYREPSENLLRAFSGATTFTEPYTDRWGTWVSVNTPLRDDQGRVEGALGVDYPADAWSAEVANSRRSAMGFSGIVVLISLTAVATSSILRARVEDARLFAAQLEAGQRELVELNRQLESLSLTDGLTGVNNRRAFDQVLAVEVAKAKRTGSNLSLLLLDIDHFKLFNDTFGHPAGDDTLKRVAALLRKSARSYDVVARYGGEEFAVILSGVGANAACLAGERYRLAVAGGEWPDRAITVSVGAASLGNESTLEELIQAADAGLYRAKAGGRNRVSGPLPDESRNAGTASDRLPGSHSPLRRPSQ